MEARYNFGVSNMARLPWNPLHDSSPIGNLLPHKTVSTDIEDVIDAASSSGSNTSIGGSDGSRLLVKSGSLLTKQPRRVSMTINDLSANISGSRRAAYKLAVSNPTYGEEALHKVGRNVLESDGAVLSLLIHMETGPFNSNLDSTPEREIDTKTEGSDDNIAARIHRSSLSRNFGRGIKIRLRPDDFTNHFRLEAMCLIVE